MTTAPVAQAQEAQYTEEGTERCLFCHGGENMTMIAQTAHGDLSNPDSPFAQRGCESCHGPGSLHVSRARGGRGFPAMLRFHSSEDVNRRNAAWTECHAQDMGDLPGIEWAGSAHDTLELTCDYCHDVHSLDNPMSDPVSQRETCADCHKKQITNHKRFESAGIVFDKLTCYDCHDVHQLIREP